MNRRLGFATLDELPPSLRPQLDPHALDVGIVHLGLGAFHRAHQAVYTQAAMIATGETSWGICGVTQRSRDVLEQLQPQDGLYSVLERGSQTRARLLVPLRESLFAKTQSAEVVSRIAAANTRVVTVTVTEKGYRRDPSSGRLNADDAETRADADGRPPLTVVGQLFRGLQRRRRDGGGPVTVLCCDNLPSNGRALRQLVEDFSALAGQPGDDGWIADNVRFPSTMVDRIVPATTEADVRDAAALLGVDDFGVVATEPFSQWVIEDDFAAARPSWEAAGAVVTADVSPYEAMKLRLLNGSHSALAYLGVLAGYDLVADFVEVDEVAGFVAALMDADVSPTLVVPAEFDLADYKTQLMRRFGNRALGHRLTQIAMDGSQKLPQRLVGVVRERLAAGASPRRAALAIAGWMRYVSARHDDAGRPIVVDDPMAQVFAARLAEADAPGEVVDALLGVTEIFGDDAGDNHELRLLLVESLAGLNARGALATIRDLAAS